MGEGNYIVCKQRDSHNRRSHGRRKDEQGHKCKPHGLKSRAAHTEREEEEIVDEVEYLDEEELRREAQEETGE